MPSRRLNTQSETSHEIESVMQKASLVVALIALGLMIGGLIDTLSSGVSLTVATMALPVRGFWHLAQAPPGLVIMSAGIILLAMLPSLRVVLAMCFYSRHHKALDALVALVVLLELLLSMWIGG